MTRRREISCGFLAEAKEVRRLAKAGSKMDTPVFRRKLRRDCGLELASWGNVEGFMILLGVIPCENGAFYEMNEQVPDSKSLICAIVEDAFDDGSIGESHGSSGSVCCELGKDVSGELAFVFEEEAFEILDIFECVTVCEFAGRVDGGGDGVLEIVSCAVDAGHAFAVFKASVAFAPSAENIEVFEREADGIKLGVAGGTAFGFCVEFDEFSDGFCAANIGFYCGNIGGGRWRRGSDETLHHPCATNDG